MGFKPKHAVMMGTGALAALLMLPTASRAWNQTEIKWKKIETEHFAIHFHEGEEWTAREVARIAEEVYVPVTRFYGHEPGMVHINISDKNDRAGGATFYYLNRIDIDASDFEFHLRGTADWLRNVITHEFTHMVTIQAAMKMPRWMPSIYLQGITFEKEKRPDVISGYPNFQASLPFAGEIVPNWLSEGVAQYQCPVARNDIWDSHRDMLLRAAALSGRLLTMDEMGVFGKNSIESEMVYNQGYSLVTYAAESYGPEKLSGLLDAHRGILRLSFNGACKKSLGISEDELYRRWVEHITGEYRKVVEKVDVRPVEGEFVSGEGYLNLFPLISPGTGGYFYLSNMGRDHMDLDLVFRDGSGRFERISGGLSSRASISPDGKLLCYSKNTDDNDHGYELNDIFIYDIGARKEKRLTRSLRAVDPVFSPDMSAIAAVAGRDGSEFIVIVDRSTGESRRLTEAVPGKRYYGLSWGDAGILASRFKSASRDIVLVDPLTGGESEIIATLADERDAIWSGDGHSIYYASDRTGIYNIYERDLGSGGDRMITNVKGGAFSPSVEGNDILFSAYGADGYKIHRIAGFGEVSVDADPAWDDEVLMSQRRSCIEAGAEGALAGYDYTGLDRKISESRKYDIEYSPVYIFPRLMYYDKTPRIGIALDSRDYLDRQSAFAAFSINTDKEYNLQFGFVTRQFKPTFSFDFFAARKYYGYFDPEYGQVKLRYDLWDAFFTIGFELEKETYRHRNEISLQYNHGEYGVNLNAWEILDIELGWNYYKANEFSLLYNYRSIRAGVDSDINPRSGRRISIEITSALDKFATGAFEYSLQPFYDDHNFFRYKAQYEEYVPLPFWSHALALYFRGAALDRTNVDDFFHLFLGSRDGMRGYTYYSMGGTRNAMTRVTYRFPLWRNINRQLFNIYLGSLYAGIFAEAGKAWDGDLFDLNGNQKDAGFELKLKGFSFYSYPLAASFEAAYGFDEILYEDPYHMELVTREGKEWKYYGSIFFSF